MPFLAPFGLAGRRYGLIVSVESVAQQRGGEGFDGGESVEDDSG